MSRCGGDLHMAEPSCPRSLPSWLLAPRCKGACQTTRWALLGCNPWPPVNGSSSNLQELAGDIQRISSTNAALVAMKNVGSVVVRPR